MTEGFNPIKNYIGNYPKGILSGKKDIRFRNKNMR